jgi:hypothetical protein
MDTPNNTRGKELGGLYSAFECFWENNEFNKVGLLLLRALDKQ